MGPDVRCCESESLEPLRLRAVGDQIKTRKHPELLSVCDLTFPKISPTILHFCHEKHRSLLPARGNIVLIRVHISQEQGICLLQPPGSHQRGGRFHCENPNFDFARILLTG